ncbi:uncharacterized protein LOC106060564 isoform X2 [Biomphalaria glabrata]|nr:uncharacterized protein LOC106060564 isoform X2 [Biomphalaria glabrata]
MCLGPRQVTKVIKWVLVPVPVSENVLTKKHAPDQHEDFQKGNKKRKIVEPVETLEERYNRESLQLLECCKLKSPRDAICRNFEPQIFSNVENLQEENIPLSSGTFGVVSRVKDRKTGHHFIKKMIISKKIELNEIKVPLLLPHKNLCAVYGIYLSLSTAFIILEDAGSSVVQLCGNNPLFAKRLSQDFTIEKLVLDMFKGLEHLHSHGLVHCDLKPENVCLKSTSTGFTLKLIDFGSCKEENEESLSGITPEYLPPSVNIVLFENEAKKLKLKPKLSGKDDVWAAGMVTLYMNKGEHAVIRHFINKVTYSVPQERTLVMQMISELKDPLPSYFTTERFILNLMFKYVLVVDRNFRWTSSQVSAFLKDQLNIHYKRKSLRQDGASSTGIIQVTPLSAQVDYMLEMPTGLELYNRIAVKKDQLNLTQRFNCPVLVKKETEQNFWFSSITKKALVKAEQETKRQQVSVYQECEEEMEYQNLVESFLKT